MKLRRKLAGFVSAAVVLSSLSTGAFAASPSDFSDMPNDWSRPALENAINNGLLNGSEGKINASGLLTRAELAAIVTRAFGATQTADISAYSDVSSGAWYYTAMQKAVYMGAFEGANGKLTPESAITRQEAFTVLARAFSLADGSASALSKFSDSSAVSSWAKGPVAALAEAGYVNGSGGRLNPTASITRAEFAQIADNLVSAYLPKEYTGTADGSAMVREAGAVLDKAEIKGDLIIGDGVGDGSVTIKDSKVAGRLVVRGGGVHSVILSGATEIGTVVISKVGGNVRVVAEGNAKVQTIVVNDGKDDVIIEGAVGKVEVASANVPVVLQNAKVDTVVVSAANADVTVDKNSAVKTVTVDKAASNAALAVAGKVDTVAVKGDGAAVTAEKGAVIAKVETAAANTEVKGAGKVAKVEAQAGSTGAKVTTSGTSITVDKGAGAVDIGGGKTVEPDKSGTTTGGSTGGGGGGGSSVTTEKLTGYLPAPLADGAVTDYKADVTKTSNLDYIDVKVSGKDLTYSLSSDTTYHISADTTEVMGKWAGIAVPVPEAADPEKTVFSWTNGDWADAAQSARAWKVINSNPFMVFYSDLAESACADHLQIVWKDAEDKVLETQKFLVDYTGIAADPNLIAITWTIGDSFTKTEWVRPNSKLTAPTEGQGFPSLEENQKISWYDGAKPIDLTKGAAAAATLTGVVGSDKFTAGNGSEQYPYLVASSEELAAVAGESGAGAETPVYFRQTGEIDLKDSVQYGTRILRNAVYDGAGNTILCSEANKLYGVFYGMQGVSVIKNLTYDLSGIDNTSWAADSAALVTYAEGEDLTLDNVTVTGSHSMDGNNGAFIGTECMPGQSSLKFTNCTYAADMQGNGYNACFIGWQAQFLAVEAGDDIECHAAITFENCAVEGSFVCERAAVFVANGTNAYNRTYSFSGNTVSGTVRGTKEAKYFTAVAIKDGYDFEAQAQQGCTLDGSGSVFVGATDTDLSIYAVNDDTAALGITASGNGGVTKYVVQVGIYTNLYKPGEAEKGGTWLYFVEEEIPADGDLAVHLKNTGFVDASYGGLTTSEDELGNAVAEIGGKPYYVISDYVDGDGNTGYVGSPEAGGYRNATVVRVSAYVGDTMYSSAVLNA